MRQNFYGVVGEIDTLPGCSQVAVSHSVFIHENARGHGLGRLANKERRNVAFNDLGYDMMICTIDSSNAAQRSLLQSENWRCLTSFKSRKTGHTVELWSCTETSDE